MSITAHDPTTQLAFSMFENPGVYAVLLGSGVSRSAGIPTGWEITLELVKRAGIAKGVEAQPVRGTAEPMDWYQWYVTTYGAEPNYSTLLEELAATPKERQAIIEGFLKPSDADLEQGRKLPTPAHRAIAELVKTGHIRVIVTTNFDRLMENALRDLGIEPTVVSSADALAGAEPLTHTQCYILKLHGDFKDARILNTDEELNRYPEAFDAQLDRILDEFGLIVAGWSGEWDHALRAAILRAANRRYSSYWLTRGRLSERALELTAHRKASLITAADADAFFNALSLKVSTIARSRLPNPASVELTVSMAKRFLAKPEFRIQLDDLVADEVERAMSLLSSMYDSEGDGDGEFEDWVMRYESAAEPLARIAAAVGRWGSAREQRLMIDVIQAFVTKAYYKRSGYEHWIELKRYPAALIYYGYGLGLTRAGRLPELYRLMAHQVAVRSDARVALGEQLSPYNLEDNVGARYWESLRDGKGGTIPFHDRLGELLAPQWATSFAGIVEPVQLYERFELFCLFDFLKYRDVDEESLDGILKYNKLGHYVFGRLGSISSARRRLAEEMLVPENRAPIAEAGFGYGNDTFLQKFFEAFRRITYT